MTTTRLEVEAALQSIFPSGVVVAAEPILSATANDLWPEERPAVAGAVPARLAEFVAGRKAARRVLQGLGVAAQGLAMGPDRAPNWPSGFSGSIAHAAGFAVAVGRFGAPLGVDLEEDADLAPDLWTIICSPDELTRLDPDHTGHLMRAVFCAKEAVFKAQDPANRALFGFEVLDVTLAEDGFDAQFRRAAGSFGAGQNIQGRFARLDGLVLAGVAR